MQGLVQVVGVIDRAEAQMLVESGVDLLGFPLRLDYHRQDLSREEAADIIGTLEPPTEAVLVTYLHRAREIRALCRELGVSMVQLHGPTSARELESLKSLEPDLRVVKSLIVRESNLLELEEQVRDFTPFVDAFITDTFDPATGASGATGKIHDWDISRRIVRMSPRPVFLAGGLHPGNVREAILRVGPAGVDAHTGLEDSRGRKDRQLVEAFVSGARAAFGDQRG